MAINLSELKKTTLKAPRILIHGGEGVGKTTFACGAPNVYMLDLEKGRAMCDPLMAQEPDSYTEVMEHLKALATQDHGYRTLVIDSLDMLESMITAYVCEQNGWKAITEPAYGKGYGARTDTCWAPFWRCLDYLRDTKNMMIILVAHSHVIEVKDPILPSFDMHTLHLYKTETAKATEWPDVIGYCMIKTYTTTEGTRNLATTANERVILTRKNPAYTAKNRYNMPEEIPLSWAEFAQHFRTNKNPNGDE
jgi:hypothetical protein